MGFWCTQDPDRLQSNSSLGQAYTGRAFPRLALLRELCIFEILFKACMPGMVREQILLQVEFRNVGKPPVQVFGGIEATSGI